MREILFRGKRIDNGEWVEGYYNRNTHNNRAEIIVYDIDGSFAYHIHPATVGQYTGLTDKNGVKIFEGNIVECVSWNEFFSTNGSTAEALRRKMAVVFHNGAFRMKEELPSPLRFNYWDLTHSGYIGVIGNTHDKEEV